jgi:hypothetical protein
VNAFILGWGYIDGRNKNEKERLLVTDIGNTEVEEEEEEETKESISLDKCLCITLGIIQTYNRGFVRVRCNRAVRHARTERKVTHVPATLRQRHL